MNDVEPASLETVGSLLSVSGGASAALWYLCWCLTTWTPFAGLMGASILVLIAGLILLTLAYRED